MALPSPIVLSETRHSGGFLVSEANGFQSRDSGSFVNAGTTDVLVQAGTVLAFSAEGTDAVIDPAGAGGGGANTGTGTLGSLSFGAHAKAGTYTVHMTAATVYTLTDPDGDVLTTTGATGTAFSDGQIGLTVTAGGTAFVAGDGFAVTVPGFASRHSVLADVVVANGGSDTGNGSLGTLTWGNTFKAGVYKLTFSSATAFAVLDPSGTSLGSGVVGTLFSNAQLGFLVSAGGTAFVSGDTITVTVPPYGDHMVNWTNAAPARAIAYNSDWVRAGQVGNIAVVARNCEVNGGELVFDSSITTTLEQEIAAGQLAGVGILVR